MTSRNNHLSMKPVPGNGRSVSSNSSSNGSPPTQFNTNPINVSNVLQELKQYMNSCPMPYMKDVNAYEKLKKVGQGTFGEVFKARCKRTGRMVALKKILMAQEKEGFPITALREIKILQQVRHPNVVELIEVCSNRSADSAFHLVFEFCEHDLAGVLCADIKLSIVHIKTMMKHLLDGLCKLHRVKILHRDLKAANVLISKEGILKLADFGLARPFTVAPATHPQPCYTNRVVTLWYRPPELLLGARQYNTKVDVWGAGCIMAELWTRKPIMQGNTEQRQLQLISTICGSMNPQVWPGIEQMPLYKNFANGPNSPLIQNQKNRLRDKMSNLMKLEKPTADGNMTDENALRLLKSMLTIDPAKRVSSEDAVDDVWFFKKPDVAKNLGDLMTMLPHSQFEYTIAKGAHGHRAHPPPAKQPAKHKPMPNLPAGQYRDMIF